MSELAIIGGTGLTQLEGLEITHRQMMYTPYGETSSPILHGNYCGKSVIFLARHGTQQTIPPHKVNYRANLWSLKTLGVTTVIAVAAVGGINPKLRPKDLVIPHQLIDYTWSREHTFFEQDLNHVTHIDFTQPYCEVLRSQLLSAAQRLNFKVHSQGVYGATQGPRLETAAEIDRMERDGCDIVGMTGMPEAALARELGLCYATCAVVANPAAGRGHLISMADIEATLAEGVQYVRQLLAEVIQAL
jgi:5'-methylthioinosine phosphorylase